jgi:hypothetical protein
MAMTNAEKQARWRDRRNELAAILEMDNPKDVAQGILKELGVDKAREVVRSLDRRLRAIKMRDQARRSRRDG